jgi:biopolymer transport protein ExbB/TolQ
VDATWWLFWVVLLIAVIALAASWRALYLANLRIARIDVIELTGRVEELELRVNKLSELFHRITTAESAARAREAKAAKHAAGIEEEAREILAHASRAQAGPASELARPQTREELKAELARRARLIGG